MESERLVLEWFKKWEDGDFLHLPISDDFKHTSPFGSIQGKERYEKLIARFKEKFLGYTFEIIDAIYEENKACIQYKALQKPDFELLVSEWHYVENGLIKEINAFYHIGEIREERKLK